MGEMITKPDANPIVFALANWIGFGALGYYLMGQQKKAMVALGLFAAAMALSVCSFGFCLPIYLYNFVLIYDAYLLGQKLQSGQSIGMNENGVEFLNAIFKD